MSSLIMHLYLAKIIQKEMEYSDDFIIGQMEPDVIKLLGKPKVITHYQDIINNKRVYNIKRYIVEELIGNKSDRKLGYLAHLIQDKINDEFLEKAVKANMVNGKESITYLKSKITKTYEEFIKDLYNDYKLTDIYIKRKYQLNIKKMKNNLLSLYSDVNILEILNKEINESIVPESTVFCIIDKEEIDSYINRCINKYKNVLNNSRE